MTSIAPQIELSDAPVLGLNSVAIFQDLTPEQRQELGQQMCSLQLARGDVLVRQGEVADALYIVVSGRFEVTVAGRDRALAQIGAGQPVGEIAFLAGGLRTATVTALRDALVLKLERAQFTSLCANSASIWQTLTFTMAKRLASMNEEQDAPTIPRARTIALIPAGRLPLPRPFVDEFMQVLSRQSTVVLVDQKYVKDNIGMKVDVDGVETMRALNALEMANDFVVFLADDDLTPWSRKAIRQADLILSIGRHDNGAGNANSAAADHDVGGQGAGGHDRQVNACETFAGEVHKPDAHKLVLVHERRMEITGTCHWLRQRSGIMHHHVALNEVADFERLCRFINGTAVGLVACGGGAFCAAHIGIYKALAECGMTFDIMGGTSGGSAMTAGFALNVDPDEMDAQMHTMFVTNKAMGRYTLPVHSLLDHTHFDAQLRDCYGARTIEDMWIPYYAISANLSRHELFRHRHGPIWEAVRASSAIPALFPPFYTSAGEMLVDGAVVDNVPVRIMHELKSGPNVVLNFKVPDFEKFAVSYDTLPTRRTLLAQVANPWRREALFQAPSITAVLMRAMMANRKEYRQHLRQTDLMLMPPLPDDMTVLDWHRHGELMTLSYDWARQKIDQLGDAGDEVFSLCRGAA